MCDIIQLVEVAGESPSVFSTKVTGSSPVITPKSFSRIFTTKYHIIRVSFDYDDWRRILIAQDVEYLRLD